MMKHKIGPSVITCLKRDLAKQRIVVRQLLRDCFERPCVTNTNAVMDALAVYKDTYLQLEDEYDGKARQRQAK